MKRFNLGERLRRLFRASGPAESLFDDLEDILVEADVGAAVSASLVTELKKDAREKKLNDEAAVIGRLKELMSRWLVPAAPVPVRGALNVFLVCGVNGVGKTTTIGKLASFYRRQNGIGDILFSAADTFRAAAGEQLALLGERLGVKVIRQAQGADPGAVVFDSLESAAAKRIELLIIDTSGRMHNKEHLVKELAKIHKIVAGKLPPGGLYHRLLVIDSTTGQNALRQAEAFQGAIGLDSIALAKFDSSAKAGFAVAIGRDLGLPFSFIGSGERFEDLAPFTTEFFLAALFDEI